MRHAVEFRPAGAFECATRLVPPKKRWTGARGTAETPPVAKRALEENIIREKEEIATPVRKFGQVRHCENIKKDGKGNRS